jgi:50S ribosomal subunit-associated GTPase HflX
MVKLITNDLTELQCGKCGVWHAIPTAMYVTCRDEGGFWHCPNGHSRGWGTGTIHAERDWLKQKVAQLDDEVADLLRARNNAQREREAAEKKLIASKRRAMAGVCPCCNRTFSNVARHVKTKHPDVALLNANRTNVG